MFDESRPLPFRKAMQCRLAIMGLYLIRLSEMAGDDGWKSRKESLWEAVIAEWKKEFDRTGREPHRYVFEYRDVAKRVNGNGANSRHVA